MFTVFAGLVKYPYTKNSEHDLHRQRHLPIVTSQWVFTVMSLDHCPCFYAMLQYRFDVDFNVVSVRFRVYWENSNIINGSSNT